jgi:hypothetical protein
VVGVDNGKSKRDGDRIEKRRKSRRKRLGITQKKKKKQRAAWQWHHS